MPKEIKTKDQLLAMLPREDTLIAAFPAITVFFDNAGCMTIDDQKYYKIFDVEIIVKPLKGSSVFHSNPQSKNCFAMLEMDPHIKELETAGSGKYLREDDFITFLGWISLWDVHASRSSYGFHSAEDAQRYFTNRNSHPRHPSGRRKGR